MKNKTQNDQTLAHNLSLHPEHFKDLRKSALSDETIRQAKLYSVPPGDINSILGPGLAAKVNSLLASGSITDFSLLAFPYPDGFVRYKLFPSITDKEGHKLKYFQPPGSEVHLYYLSEIENKLADPSIPLIITEGEKKSLSLHQIDILTVGLGGDWGWMQEGKPISDLNKIAWIGREVIIVPDSDAWTNQEIRNAYYSFAIEIQNRGADLKFKVIPQVGKEKIGVDDFLVARGPKKFEELKKIDLKHGVFTESKAWHKKWIKPKEEPSKTIDTDAIIVHPSYDVNHQKSFVSIGFRKTIISDNKPEDHNFYLISEGAQVKLTEDSVYMFNGTKLIFDDKDRILNRVDERWDLGKILDFIRKPISPSHVYLEIKNTLKEFLELQSEEDYGLMTAYIITTYFHRLFNAIPFLFLYGEKVSGKTRALETCQRLCFNGFKIKGVSVPSMADSIDSTRATFIMDQAESLSDPRNTELVGIMADSYTSGGGRRRVIDTSNNKRRILEFETFGPKIFASRHLIDPDLKDRCILIHMLTTKKQFPDPVPFDPRWADLRDKLYTYSLINWKKIRDLYLDSGKGVTQRVRELYRPIETVLQAEDVPKEEMGLIRTAFLKSMEETQFELTENDHELFRALLDLLLLKNPEEGMLSIKEIVEHMNPDLLPTDGKGNRLSDRGLHTWMGRRIGVFNLCNKQNREGHAGKRIYYFSYEHVKDVYSLYSNLTGVNQERIDEDLREIKI